MKRIIPLIVLFLLARPVMAATSAPHKLLSADTVAMVTAPEGMRAFNEAHPTVEVWAAALDEKLNEKAYIVPGLGDAGDRLFET